MNSFRDQNRRAWDRMAETGSQFARVATDEECARPLETLDSRGWLPPSVAGQKVLCLASGGGWQSILYATAGADVTVVDLSPSMLALDDREARRRGLSVQLRQQSMDDLSGLVDGSFDIVHHPVSTCYVRDLAAVYGEVARVLKPGGLYVSQHKQPVCLQVVERDRQDRYVIGIGYYHEGPLPPVADVSYREPGAVEYLHRWQDLIGNLCRAGFVVEDLIEPKRGDPTARPGHYRHRGMSVPPFVRIKARRVATATQSAPAAPIWLP
ncbi:MAG: class I SAM-dependent methyltransferase [Planctomycetaceae bacterium]